jgi:fructose-1,6-bisphosphatase/inositol monophosphatase family enzyme
LLPWDHAAGFLIHKESGGIGRMLNGRRYRPSDPSIGGLLAPDLELWNQLWTILVADEEPPELEAD